jgi:hypothetical protein
MNFFLQFHGLCGHVTFNFVYTNASALEYHFFVHFNYIYDILMHVIHSKVNAWNSGLKAIENTLFISPYKIL